MAEPTREMRNPFRSEADAFRLLVMIVAAAAVVIAAALLVGSWLGVTLALIAVSVGLYASIGWLRLGLGERDEEPEEDR
ncbi:MAG: hypothetical protein H0V25_11720 [Solirubrobacterales bacterium]|nr:hypothetical protein [Solirubrobacterales bacterium]